MSLLLLLKFPWGKKLYFGKSMGVVPESKSSEIGSENCTSKS